MNITIGGEEEALAYLATNNPERVISIFSPTESPFVFHQTLQRIHLRTEELGIPRLDLEFDDVQIPRAGYANAERGHVQKAIAFGKGLDERRNILIHCAAGVSRSTSIALAMLMTCMSAATAVVKMYDARPQADPNTLVMGLTEEIYSLEPGTLKKLVRHLKPMKVYP